MRALLHQPVLGAEVVAGLSAAPGLHFIDGTLGGGGHARRLLAATAPNGRVLAIDWDGAAVRRMQAEIADIPEYQERLILVHGNFKNLAEICRQHAFTPTGGCLLDLGVSSPQLDEAARGFGFHADTLDFRFDAAANIPTAADLLNRLSERELETIFRDYGEEPLAHHIAAAVVSQRERAPLRKPDEVTAIAAAAYQRRWHTPSRRNPATRVFQALRIAVNDELENLSHALVGALRTLPAGARIAAISFHSLEDRIVKQFFRTEASGCLCPPTVPVCQCGHQPAVKIVTPKPIRPTRLEMQSNPRSRSAKLRIALVLAKATSPLLYSPSE